MTLCNPSNPIAHQAPLSMGFSRQEYWSELPFPPPGDLPDPGIEPASPTLQADSSLLTHRGSPLINVAVVQLLRCVQLLVTPRTAARQAPLFMGFSRQEYWSEVPCPPPGDLPHPGIEPVSPLSPASAGRFFTTSITWKAQFLP